MRYIVTIIVLICLTACTNDEAGRTTETTERGQHPIAFREAYTAQPTRSNARFTAIKGIPVGQSMGVYAYQHDVAERDYTTDMPNFMWNQQVMSMDQTEPFTYAPLKYWPNDESQKLSFIAYFPYTEESPGHVESPEYPDNPTGLRTLLANDDTGLPYFVFTVKENAAEQVDFLVSEVIANLPKTRDTDDDPHKPFNDLSIYDRVPFLFYHMTAKVEFRIVADAEIRKDIVHFRLKDLRLTNVNTTGTLTPSYNAETGTSFAWSDLSTKRKYAFTTYVPQLLLPQLIGDDVMLNLDYEITFKGDGTTYSYDGSGNIVEEQEYTYGNIASLQLNTMKATSTGIPVGEWRYNHHYVYTIRLRANRIEFDAEVVEWGDTHSITDIPIEEP